jgi:hypothetical protein
VETIQDFEGLLHLLHKHHVGCLIIGGLAFIYHAKPRYAKDMDIWIDSPKDNVDGFVKNPIIVMPVCVPA